jgi:hypothetical protein
MSPGEFMNAAREAGLRVSLVRVSDKDRAEMFHGATGVNVWPADPFVRVPLATVWFSADGTLASWGADFEHQSTTNNPADLVKQVTADSEPCAHCNGSGVDPEYGDICSMCEGSGLEPNDNEGDQAA